VLKVSKDFKVQRVLVPKVLKEFKVPIVQFLVLRVLKEYRVLKEFKVFKVLREILEEKV
jgi:hypothetical protein